MLRWLFFTLLARPLCYLIIGLNVRHAERLPARGPAVLVANHNSHLDTLVLMSLLPRHCLPALRPVAAADYFLRKRWLAWFALNIMGIIPIRRQPDGARDDPLAEAYAALERGEILILFPEGSRGEPEHLGQFKNGIARLARQMPQVPVIPIFTHGLGKTLPRGEWLLVPFFCDIFVGQALAWNGDRHAYMQQLDAAMRALAAEGQFAAWE
jgi:1-acyl-sn-glycerol-3-phosphate acyltransferase